MWNCPLLCMYVDMDGIKFFFANILNKSRESLFNPQIPRKIALFSSINFRQNKSKLNIVWNRTTLSRNEHAFTSNPCGA